MNVKATTAKPLSKPINFLFAFPYDFSTQSSLPVQETQVQVLSRVYQSKVEHLIGPIRQLTSYQQHLCALLSGLLGGCIDILGWAELIANWPGTSKGRSRPGRETRVSLQCSCVLDMESCCQCHEAHMSAVHRGDGGTP